MSSESNTCTLATSAVCSAAMGTRVNTGAAALALINQPNLLLMPLLFCFAAARLMSDRAAVSESRPRSASLRHSCPPSGSSHHKIHHNTCKSEFFPLSAFIIRFKFSLSASAACRLPSSAATMLNRARPMFQQGGRFRASRTLLRGALPAAACRKGTERNRGHIFLSGFRLCAL